MTFNNTLFTWNSYNAPGTGTFAGTGYHDSFSVSVSSTPYDASLGLTDPIDLPGLGFIWGGNDYADNVLECNPSSNAGCGNGTYEGLAPALRTVTMQASSSDNYLNIVLDTLTPPETDGAHPSYGQIEIVSIDQVPAGPPPVIVASRAAFAAALVERGDGSRGFDGFVAGTVLTAFEYQLQGVTFSHLDGQPIKIAQRTFENGPVIPSPPNGDRVPLTRAKRETAMFRRLAGAPSTSTTAMPITSGSIFRRRCDRQAFN